MPAQGRLGDKAKASSDAHGCPACPHPVTGPGISGSPNVFVNKRPALRQSDHGVHAACCTTNTWVAQAGSSTVFINGKAAHRVGDATSHCGGSGKLAEGSDNVTVGDSGGGGGGAAGPPIAPPPPPMIRAGSMPSIAQPGAPTLFKIAIAAAKSAGFAKAVTWLVGGEQHPLRGDAITITFGKQHAGKHVPVKARLGDRTVETVVAVPKLIVEGPDHCEIDEEIVIHAKVVPQVAGRYLWFDKKGKRLGEGPKLAFVGKERSKDKGDQPVECRFVAEKGGSKYSEKHPITVEKIPRLKLPIIVSLPGFSETVRWLRDNPVEVTIDSSIVGSHAMVESAGRIVVSFRAKEGEHAIVISSGPRSSGNRTPLRLVHFSAKVKVKADDSK